MDISGDSNFIQRCTPQGGTAAAQLEPVPGCERTTRRAHSVLTGLRYSAACKPVLPLPESLP